MNRLANGILMGALLFLLMVGAYLQGGSSLGGDAPSVFSKTDSGRSVLFELYSKLGFEVRAWTQAPGMLPRTDSLLFVSQVPVAPEHYALESEAEPSPDAAEPGPGRRPLHQRLYDPGHYRSFVEQGGTLMLSVDPGSWRFLAEHFQLDLGVDSLPDAEAEEEEQGFFEEALEELEQVLDDDFDAPEDWDPAAELELDSLNEQPEDSDPAKPRGALEAWLWADQAPALREALRLSWDFGERIEQLESLQPLVTTHEGAWVVASRAVGAGRLVLLESDRFLDNDRVGLEQNALLAVRLAERLSGDRRLFFDEYSLGGWTPDSPLEMAFSSAARPLTLHLFCLLLLLIWLSAWVRWFPRDPAPLAAVSASMRARGLAGMLMRRGRWEVLGQMLRLGVLRRLGRSAGMSKQLLAEDSLLQEPEVLQQLLKPLFPAQDEARMAWAMGLLRPGELNSRWELDELGIALAELEAGALEHTAGDSR